MLKAAEISSTPKPLSQLDFPLTITTPSIEGNTFNYTPVVSQCILIAADQNSTALLLANRPDQTWGQDNCILCVSVKRKLKQVSPTPSPPFPPESGGKKFTWVRWYTARVSHTRTEGWAKRLCASENPEQLHEGWNEASEKENSLKNAQTPPQVPHIKLANTRWL